MRKELIFSVSIFVLMFYLVYAGNFADTSQGDFNLGTYANTSHNGTGVVLAGNNLTGTYTSRVFDAGSFARWENLTGQGNLPTKEYLFAVDGNGQVYASSDQGVTWIQKNASYGRTTDTWDMFSDSIGNLYIISNNNREVWRSNNSGISWVKVNDSFANNDLFAGGADSQYIYAIAGQSLGAVFRSSDAGVTWTQVNASYNGGNGAAKGMAHNSSNSVFAVDGNGQVYASSDQGVTWIQKNASYGRTTDTWDMFSDSIGNLYIISNNNREVWRSNNSGISWVKVNDSFANNDLFAGGADSQYIYAIAGQSLGAVFRSSDAGVTWTQVNASYNGGNGAAKGMANLIKQTNLTYQVRNCSLSNCSDGSWQNVNQSNINLTGRYFQYKAYFSSQEQSLTPLLYNVSLGYTILDSSPPTFSDYIENPGNGSAYSSGQVYRFNVTIADSSAIGSVWIEFNGVNYTAGIINTSSIYTFTKSDLAAGTYSYKWLANDSYGNLNNSGIIYYSVNKAENTLTLLSSASWNYDYGTESSFSCSSLYGTPKLYINNSEFTNPVTIILQAGQHNIKCNISETENYSSGMAQGALTINKADSQVSLTFDKTSPQIYRTNITPSCSLLTGIGTPVLRMDGNIISSGAELSLGAGNYSFNCSLNSSQNYSYSENVSIFIIDKTSGNISLLLNEEESDITIEYPQQYNISARTLYGGVIIYFNGSDITSNNSLNATPPRNSGYYNITALSSGDENHSSAGMTRWLNVTIDSISPEINIISPQEGGSYGYNTSLALTFSVSDEHPGSCWYNLNSGENITLANCSNATFDTGADGGYILYLYANDTLGNLAVKNSSFSILVGFPTITLNSPISIYLNTNNVYFRYIPTDLDLQACELWGNFTGEFKLNQTVNTPENGTENTFSLVLPDGSYKWNIRCNDSQGHSAFNGNKTFYVDTIAPSIALSEPKGTKNSWTGIPLTFSVSDNSPVTCKYSVSWAIGGVVISNTSIANCTSTIFNLSSLGDYVLSLHSADFAGNSNFTSTSFSVSTAVPPSDGGGSSGGGGGGGGGIGSAKKPNKTEPGKIQVGEIGNIIAESGEKKTLPLNVKNIGTIFLNSCRLISKGEISSWIYSRQIEGIAPGENVNFIFDLNVPEETLGENYKGELEIRCNEINYSRNIFVSIPKSLDFIKIQEVIQQKNSLNITYTFNNTEFIGRNISIDIWLSDENTSEIKRIRDFFIVEEIPMQREIIMDIPSDLSGVYTLYFALSSEIDKFVKKPVVLGITGKVILDSPKSKKLIYIIFVIIIGIAVFFIIRSQMKKSPGRSKIKKLRKIKIKSL